MSIFHVQVRHRKRADSDCLRRQRHQPAWMITLIKSSPIKLTQFCHSIMPSSSINYMTWTFFSTKRRNEFKAIWFDRATSNHCTHGKTSKFFNPEEKNIYRERERKKQVDNLYIYIYIYNIDAWEEEKMFHSNQMPLQFLIKNY